MRPLGPDLFIGGSVSSVNPYPVVKLLSNLRHAYRADLIVAPLNGSAVAQWNDLISTANLLQATGANQPAFNASDAAYNGQPTVQSTATNMFLAASGIAATQQPCTIWVVGEFSTNGAALVTTGPSGTPPVILRSSVNVAMNAGSTLSSGVASAAKHATLAVYSGASSFIGCDNWLTGGVSGSAGVTNGATSIGAFAYSNGTFGTLGKIAELIIQSGIPTSAEKTAMAAYFLARYGITVT